VFFEELAQFFLEGLLRGVAATGRGTTVPGIG
jgi:hypothetical protein